MHMKFPLVYLTCP